MAARHEAVAGSRLSVEALSYVKALCAAADGPVVTSSEKLVLRALALMHKVEVNCAFGSIGSIAAEALLHERSVQRVLRSLQTKGLVLRHEARRDSNGSQTTNEYELPGMQSTAVGLERRQQVFKVSRTRVAVQLTLPGEAGDDVRGPLATEFRERDGELESMAAGLECARQVASAGMQTAVDFSLATVDLSPPPVTPVVTPPGDTCCHPIEVVLEARKEGSTPPLPLHKAVGVENPAKSCLMKARAQGQEQATATATATTRRSEAVRVTTESGGRGERGVRPARATRRGREREALDGVDAALWDEATRVLVACGIAEDASTRRVRRAVLEALRLRVQVAGCGVADAGGLAVARWREYRGVANRMSFVLGVRRFFAEGYWLDADLWPWTMEWRARRDRI